MDYISMLNPISFYHLWQFEYGRVFINKMINSIIGKDNCYNLLDFFNDSFNSVRSYCIFESDSNIVLIDFNLNKRVIDDDIGIVNFLESYSAKDIYLIVYNNFKGNNIVQNKIYNLFKEDNIMFADNRDKQDYYDKELSRLLYSMNNDLYQRYLHENSLLQ